MGTEDDSDLAFFPAMDMTAAKKLALLEQFFGMLLAQFTPLTIGEHVRAVRAVPRLPAFRPKFSHSA